MAFTKLVSFTKKVADLADKPALSASQLKAQFDSAPDEVRQYLNSLIDGLKSTTSGDSGAKNVGVTAISGTEGTDIQAILEYLAANKVTKAGDTMTGDITFSGTAKGVKFNVGRTNTSGISWNANTSSDFGLRIVVDGTDVYGIFKDGTLQAIGDAKLSGGIVSLRASGAGVYCHNTDATAFKPIFASSFDVNSRREDKKDITPYEVAAEELVNGSTVYQYHYNNESETDPKHTGLILDEAPSELASPSGIGIDIYAMTAVLWKAVQELSAKNAALEARVEALEGV